jgi:hypothetical protein
VTTSTTRDDGNGRSQSALSSKATRSRKRTRRRRTALFLASSFVAANLLSAVTWSVLHHHHSSYSEKWTSSSMAAVDTILNDLLLFAPEKGYNNNSTIVVDNHAKKKNHILDADADQGHRRPGAAAIDAVSPVQSTDAAYPLLRPHTTVRRQLLYQRIVEDFTRHGWPIGPTRPKRGVTCVHRNVMENAARNQTSTSTIEYIACCGLGHRLSRMSAAAHVATKLQAHLYTDWQCCNKVEVFSYLFGNDPIILYKEQHDQHDGDPRANSKTTPPPPPPRQQQQQQEASIHLQFRNDVPGFKEKTRKCSCSQDKITSDFAFYSTLRQRYTKKHSVDDFVRRHFTNQTLSIAMHIRAGNGETGEFSNKNRTIDDPVAFVRKTTDMIRAIIANNSHIIMTSSSSSQRQVLSPLVFIATDTLWYVDAFRKALSATSNSSTGSRASIPVVTLPTQVHAPEGQGVLFGASHKVARSGEQCEAGWDAVVQDMLVMSHADIVFGPTYSSFTQSLPLSLSMGRRRSSDGEANHNRHHHNIQAPFCDVRFDKLHATKVLNNGAALRLRSRRLHIKMSCGNGAKPC